MSILDPEVRRKEEGASSKCRQPLHGHPTRRNEGGRIERRGGGGERGKARCTYYSGLARTTDKAAKAATAQLRDTKSQRAGGKGTLLYVIILETEQRGEGGVEGLFRSGGGGEG